MSSKNSIDVILFSPYCSTDTFTVRGSSSTGYNQPPTICGTNTNEHSKLGLMFRHHEKHFIGENSSMANILTTYYSVCGYEWR